MWGSLRRFFGFRVGKKFEKAMELYNCHLYKEAIEIFQEILTEKKSASSLYYNLASAYSGYAYRNLGFAQFSVGNYRDALHNFRKAEELTAEQIDLHQFIGTCLNNLGEHERAVKVFSFLLDLDPSKVCVKMKLAIALINLELWDDSIRVCREILQAHSNYADMWLRLGLAYLGKGMATDAKEAFHEALRLNPQYLEAKNRLGITLAYLGEFDEAMRTLSEIIESGMKYADVYYHMAIVEIARQNYGEAAVLLSEALAINPRYKEALLKLGLLHCKAGDISSGLLELRQALLIDPEDNSLRPLLAAIDSVVASSSGSEEAMRAVINQLMGEEGSLVPILREFHKRIEIKPSFSEVVSVVLPLISDDSSACEMLLPQLQGYIAQNPTYPDLHNSLGCVYMKLNRMSEAEDCFRTALRLNPEYLKARMNLFRTLKLSHKVQEALNEAEFLLRKELPYPDLYVDVSELCAELSLHERALQNVETAIQIKPHYARAYFVKALLLEKQRKLEEARSELATCLKLKPAGRLLKLAEEAMLRLIDDTVQSK